MNASPKFVKGITLGLEGLHPNTNTSSAEKLARLAYARVRIHTTRVMPRWEELSHESQQARQDAACAILDEVYYVSREHITPRKMFELLTRDSTLDATVAKHEAVAP